MGYGGFFITQHHRYDCSWATTKFTAAVFIKSSALRSVHRTNQLIDFYWQKTVTIILECRSLCSILTWGLARLTYVSEPRVQLRLETDSLLLLPISSGTKRILESLLSPPPTIHRFERALSFVGR